MKTRIITLFSCFVFALSLAPLWTACSVEDVPVPEEEPGTDQQRPGSYRPSFVGTVWYCVSASSKSTVTFSPQTNPVGHYVLLKDNGILDSDMLLFPRGTTYKIEEEMLIITPTKTYELTLMPVTDMNEMTWMLSDSTNTILLNFETSYHGPSQGENNNGGTTDEPVGGTSGKKSN